MVPSRVSSGKLAAASVATRSKQHFARGTRRAIDLKFKGIFQNDDEGNKKHARYVYAKEYDGCFSPELACYWASLSFHGEGQGAPSFHQWVLISRLALDFDNLVNLHPATSMAHRESTHMSLKN